MAIQTPDERLRVFVSSTLGELAAERRAVARAIRTARLTPVMFEAGARPHPPGELYRAYLARSDVFVGLYWQSYGWVGPGMRVSGLEEEFELSHDLPRLLYVKAPATDREPRLTALLDRISGEVSYRPFETPAELGRLVRDDLAALLSERFAAGLPGAGATAGSPGPPPLPVSLTSLFGREGAIEELAALLVRPQVRLVTLTGPGGVGKTRLAGAVGHRVRDRFAAGTAFVPLAGVTDSRLGLAEVGRVVMAGLTGTGSPMGALAERLGGDPWLLILDNLEHIADVAGDLGELLARCPGTVVLATSRVVLGLAVEREYPVPPLPISAADSATGAPLADVANSPAAALFVHRARVVRPDFTLTQDNAAAVAEICRRLEGLPLAIELAAARIRLLDPDALLHRLIRSLDTLGTGSVDLPERQHTLRATVEWSLSLLDEQERSLLETVSVFDDGWTIEATAEVAGLAEDRALALSEALARHSLIQLETTQSGPRLRMLETIRVFAAERLASRPDAREIRRRHAGFYRALAEQADRALRGDTHQKWLHRLEAETGNLAGAVHWFLEHDPTPLPHLFRVLWPFWSLRIHLGEAHLWVARLLRDVDTLDPQARAELLCTQAVTACEVGDDASGLAAGQGLVPLLPQIREPLLHSVCRLAIAWISPITGDLDEALRAAAAGLSELRDQDEPFWTALAAFTTGVEEMTMDSLDEAAHHLSQACDQAEQFESTWLAAASRTQLGTLAVAQGKLGEARDLLCQALDLSPTIYRAAIVPLSLAAFARLAFAEGHRERAALLAGAADGLRRRAGLHAWPLLRRGEADLVTDVRQALGGERFDHLFTAGSGLSQRDALAVVRD